MKYRDLHPNIKIRISTNFVRKLFNDMVAPFMVVYLTVHFGAKWAGLMMVGVILSGILASLYGGYYADLKGRKRVVVFAESLNFLMLLGMALCNSPWLSLPLLTFLFYFVKNVVVTLSTPAADAMVIDVSTPDTRKFIYSISYWVNNLSFAVGSIVGAFLYQDYFFEVLLTAALATLAIFLVFALFTTETLPPSGRPRPERVQLPALLRSYREVVRDSVFLKFIVCSILVMSIEYQLGSYISVRLLSEFPEQRLFDWLPTTFTGVNMYGLLRAENTILVVCFALLLERLFRRMGDAPRLYWGTAVFTVGFMAVSVSNVGWVLLLATLVFTMGELLYVPVKQALLAQLVRDDARTQYLAVYGLHFRSAQIVASLFITVGAVISSWGIALLIGLMGTVSLFLYADLMKRPQNTSTGEVVGS